MFATAAAIILRNNLFSYKNERTSTYRNSKGRPVWGAKPGGQLSGSVDFRRQSQGCCVDNAEPNLFFYFTLFIQISDENSKSQFG